MTDVLTAIGTLLAGVAGCTYLIKAGWRAFFGGEERRANAAAALTGAAKMMVDELQEEVHAAREEAKAARRETAELRAQIGEMRRLADKEVAELRTKVQVLQEQNRELRQELARRRP